MSLHRMRRGFAALVALALSTCAFHAIASPTLEDAAVSPRLEQEEPPGDDANDPCPDGACLHMAPPEEAEEEGGCTCGRPGAEDDPYGTGVPASALAALLALAWRRSATP